MKLELKMEHFWCKILQRRLQQHIIYNRRNNKSWKTAENVKNEFKFMFKIKSWGMDSRGLKQYFDNKEEIVWCM